MLPFNKDNNKKKYWCFICGIEFTDFEEYKSHIKEKHEYGREYLSCPYCDAPVRDMRLHFKVRHPKETMPKSGQMKALIFYDFSGKNAKKKHKKPHFEEGFMVSNKNNGQVMHYRSGWELTVYQVLEELNEILAYEVEPSDCVTNYFCPQTKKWRKYYPDLKVRFTDGHTEVWEIKPLNQTDPKTNTTNHAKWNACSEACLNHGIIFEVKTEVGIKKLQRALANQKKAQDENS